MSDNVGEISSNSDAISLMYIWLFMMLLTWGKENVKHPIEPELEGKSPEEQKRIKEWYEFTKEVYEKGTNAISI